MTVWHCLPCLLKAWLIFPSFSCRWSLWFSTRVEHIWLSVDQTSEFTSASSGLKCSTSLVSRVLFSNDALSEMPWVFLSKNVLSRFFCLFLCHVSCRSLWSGDRRGFRWTCSVPGFHWHGQKSQILQPVIEIQTVQETCDHFPTANTPVSNSACVYIDIHPLSYPSL